MRTIECNECGEPITAADDDELARNLRAHLSGEHDVDLDADDAAELVGSEAYDATDS